MELTDLKAGDRVELHPGTDWWARGERYAEVASVGRSKVTLRGERSGITFRLYPRNIERLAPAQ